MFNVAYARSVAVSTAWTHGTRSPELAGRFGVDLVEEAMNPGDHDPARALRILSQLSQDHASYAPKDFLKRIADVGCELLNVPVCILWKRDDKSDRLKIQATSGKVDDSYRSTELDPELPHLRKNRSGYLSDARKPHEFYKHQAEAARHGWVSLLTAPLRAGSHLVGMIDVYTTTKPRRFSDVERHAFTAFANAISLYLWNQDVQAEHVIEVYDEIRAAASPLDLSQRIIEWNVNRLRADFGHIRLLENRTNQLVFAAAAARGGTRSPYEALAERHVPVGSGISGRVAASGQPYNSPELRAEPAFQRLRESLDRTKRRSQAYDAFWAEVLTERTLPLRTRKSVTYALVNVWGIVPDVLPPISKLDVETMFLECLKDVGISPKISLDRIGTLLSLAEWFEAALTRFLQDSRDVFHGYAAQVRLFDRASDELVYIAGLGPVDHFASHSRRSRLDDDVFTTVFKSGVRRLTPRLREDGDFTRLTRRYRSAIDAGHLPRNSEFEEFLGSAQAEMTVPLSLGKGAFVGCATLTTREPVGLDESAAQDFQDMLGQMARGITRAARNAEISIRDLVATVVRFKEVLSKALDRLVQLRHPAKYAQVWLVEPGLGLLHRLASTGLSIDWLPRTVPFSAVPEYAHVLDDGDYYETHDLRGQGHFNRRSAEHVARRTEIVEYEEYLDAIRSALVVPLRAEGRLIGTATLESREPAFFGDWDLGLFANSMKYAAELIAQSQHAEAMQQLQSEIKTIGAPDRLSRLLRHLARNAIQLVGADIVAIYQYDPDEATFSRTVVIEGVLIRPVDIGRPIHERWIPAFMVRERRSFVAAEVKDIPGMIGLPTDFGARRWDFATRERVKSAAGFVLEAGGQTIGVIYFNFRNKQSFTTSRQQLMQMFASEASIAIQNARLYRSALLRGLQVDRDQDSLSSALTRVLSYASGKLNAEAGHIRLYDPINETLDKIAWYGEPSRSRKTLRRGEGLSSALIDAPGPIIIPNIEKSPYRRRPDWIRDLQFRSFACLRLTLGERFVGTLFLAATAEATFRNEQRDDLESYCRLALKEVQEWDNRSKQSARQKVFTELESLLEEHRALSQKIALILTAVTMEGGLEYNRALIFLRPPGRTELVCEYGIFPRDREDAERAYKEWDALKLKMSIRPALRSLIALGGIAELEDNVKRRTHPPDISGEWGTAVTEANQSLAVVYCSHAGRVETAGSLHETDILRKLEAEQFALVPLITPNGAIGVLYVDNKFTTHARPIDDDDLALLRLYADRAATAISQSRRLEDQDDPVEDAMTLSAAKVVAGIAHQLGPVLGATHTTLQRVTRQALPPAAKDDVTSALEDTVRAKNLIQYWQNYGEGGRSRIQQFLRSVPLQSLLEALGQAIREVVTTQSAVATVHEWQCQPQLPLSQNLLVNVDVLRADFQNFAKDSLRYKGTGLVIRLSAEHATSADLEQTELPRAGRFTKLLYQDNGPGIPPERRKEIFRFGYSSGVGSGLGLALAHRHAKDHGGALIERGRHIPGGGEGSGVQFELYLPAL